PDDRDLLARPLAPGLHLAGEATWSAHPGTMHGAWWSGERAARQVIEDTGADDTAARGARAPVVVIGAGLAGLAAARLLASAGGPSCSRPAPAPAAGPAPTAPWACPPTSVRRGSTATRATPWPSSPADCGCPPRRRGPPGAPRWWWGGACWPALTSPASRRHA